ncbi:oxidoreductase [Streptomyces sp. 1331.2]|uniref:oxidoreductase n=1 Tax=Streptomyces sp. 1331.2 TaxID=1938835 RepID=UPI000BC941E6|nr:oxidoreductase [Streptomyces sp. 1331.2]SOB83802.1 NADP-dependent 3-hydroxy acid dehydrogenase YdfG [Streptomyces sp. 1331.2]
MTANEGTTGKVWLITGANSGFGQAIAEAAIAAGDTVVAAARRPETLAELAAAHPGRVVPVRLDVTDHDQISAAVEEALSRLGRIDVLVNNAGRGLIGAVEEYTDRELRDLMDLHFFGPAALTRAVLPHMRAQGSGAVVQMSSMGGRFSFPGVGAYSATKFALEGLSEALAQEVAGFGIKVLVVEPGAFRTGFAGGGALAHTTPIAAYEPVVGPVRTGLPDSDGKQPGDPTKAAAAILAALAAERTPLRLALGNDAVDAVLGQLDAARQEAEAWAEVGRGTDFPAGE